MPTKFQNSANINKKRAVDMVWSESSPNHTCSNITKWKILKKKMLEQKKSV